MDSLSDQIAFLYYRWQNERVVNSETIIGQWTVRYRHNILPGEFTTIVVIKDLAHFCVKLDDVTIYLKRAHRVFVTNFAFDI